ncbi:MAG TPA: hypothetical protein VKS79_10770 [Gemmataceae bacterium]|nr:hypothetical protein [Gemmataceae bacterium]
MRSPDDSPEVPEGAAVFPVIPPELGVHPLLLAVLHAIVFLQGSEADIVNPDAAEEQMEYIAGYLQRLCGAELQRMREDLETLAGFAKEEGWDANAIQFVKGFLGDFGVG